MLPGLTRHAEHPRDGLRHPLQLRHLPAGDQQGGLPGGAPGVLAHLRLSLGDRAGGRALRDPVLRARQREQGRLWEHRRGGGTRV